MNAAVDPLNAYVAHTAVHLPGKPGRALSGLTFAVKDIYDLEGCRTGCGNPRWLETHGPATTTAPALQAVLDAGAELTGKVHTDELAYSLNGENAHYGTPRNSKAPTRIPGGSSSGSAAVVAGGAVDFALGSDTGGSVRVPASYCGILGIRTTHGRIATTGLMPLAPSFDTVGWFAREPAIMRRVGGVLLAGGDTGPRHRLVLASDAFAMLDDSGRDGLRQAVDRVKRHFASATDAAVSPVGLAAWMQAFRPLQAREVWACHGAWIEAHKPTFGPGIAERFAWARTVSEAEVAPLRGVRQQAAVRLRDLLGGDALLCLPTAPGAAPIKGTSGPALEEFRGRALSLTAIAGLSGCPQISLPLGETAGAPLGLSLLGPPGTDELLLALAERILGD
ncbi:MAG: amidase [Alphaproteobacteria bacterium]|nr:amidase [Alphaproteobacteria bacterium]